MGEQIGKATRLELIQAVSERYQGASLAEKRRILDEFVALIRALDWDAYALNQEP